MTNPNYTHLVLIVDRSGSMHPTAQDATGGIRQFLEDQRVLPEVTVSLYQFDVIHNTIHDFARLDAALAAPYTLVPRGGTALLDAVGFAVTQVGERLAAMDEADRPGKVAVLIVTDGLENSSTEYTREQVKELLTRQQAEYGWGVTYIGANVDAFSEASAMGVTSSLDYTSSAAGTRGAWRGASNAAVAFASGQTAGLEYSDKDRAEAAQE